jgi:hypothetical protein
MSDSVERDSGLHLSMRVLLGIVAGLIITDLLRFFVKAIGAEISLDSLRTYNVALAGAALIFVTRVLVDNSLYYARPDAKTQTPVYIARLSLIFLDLLSYAACYHVVTQGEVAAGKRGEIILPMIRTIAVDVVFIEATHFVWCVVALIALRKPKQSDDLRKRRSWLPRWAFLSGTSAVIGGTGLCLGSSISWTPHTWINTLTVFVLLSTVAYVTLMSREYLGDWRAPAPNAAGSGSAPL